MTTSEVDLSLVERHFLALQISMESNDKEFNKLFSKGMVSEEIDKLRKASKNKFKSKDDGKRFTTDPKHDENIALATDLIKIVKKRKNFQLREWKVLMKKLKREIQVVILSCLNIMRNQISGNIDCFKKSLFVNN